MENQSIFDIFDSGTILSCCTSYYLSFHVYSDLYFQPLRGIHVVNPGSTWEMIRASYTEFILFLLLFPFQSRPIGNPFGLHSVYVSFRMRMQAINLPSEVQQFSLDTCGVSLCSISCSIPVLFADFRGEVLCQTMMLYDRMCIF